MLAFCASRALRELRRGAAGVGAEAAPQPMRLYHVKAGCGRRKLLGLSCIAAGGATVASIYSDRPTIGRSMRGNGAPGEISPPSSASSCK